MAVACSLGLGPRNQCLSLESLRVVKYLPGSWSQEVAPEVVESHSGHHEGEPSAGFR